MAKSRYEYGTNPRKLQPDVKRKQQPKKKLKVVEDLPQQKVKISKAEQKKQMKSILIVLGIFILLFAISYRNSEINEKFNQVQTLIGN